MKDVLAMQIVDYVRQLFQEARGVGVAEMASLNQVRQSSMGNVGRYLKISALNLAGLQNW
jgi:hypothetical protein